jgi:hypothetical protein
MSLLQYDFPAKTRKWPIHRTVQEDAFQTALIGDHDRSPEFKTASCLSQFQMKVLLTMLDEMSQTLMAKQSRRLEPRLKIKLLNACLS